MILMEVRHTRIISFCTSAVSIHVNFSASVEDRVTMTIKHVLSGILTDLRTPIINIHVEESLLSSKCLSGDDPDPRL